MTLQAFSQWFAIRIAPFTTPTHLFTGELGTEHEWLPGESKFFQLRAARIDQTKFFITTAPASFLDGKHTVFGRMTEGMLTLPKMENVTTGNNNRPKLSGKITV